MKTVQGILPIIKGITSNCESGRLDVDYAGTHGTLLFKKGRLIHASLGSLTGFQAVNAAVALRFVQYSFDPSASISHSSSITASERVVLRRFFGIEAAEIEEATDAVEPEVDWSTPPEPVVPLAAAAVVAQPDLADTPTVEVERVPPPFARARSKPNRRPLLLAVCVALLVGLTIGAIAFKTRLAGRTGSVAILAKSEAQPVADVSKQPVADISKSEVKQVAPATSAVKQVAPAAPAVAAASESNKRDANVPNLTGEWRIINTVQKTAYKSFDNMEVGFRLSINQNGKDFTAKGEKFSENGKALPPASRTPIHLTGSIDGDKVLATFVEDGKMRRTNGRFVWKLNSNGLTGTFVSSAANSSGKSALTKQ